jgi:hypothetical protein
MGPVTEEMTMLTRMKLAFATAAALIGGAATFASANGGGRGQLLQKYDTNGDGKLDDAERAAMRADFAAKRAEWKQKMLAKYDANRDGTLDPAERQVMKHDRKIAQFKALDSNGDGVISLAEFENGKLGHQHRMWHGRFRSGGGQDSAK